MQRYEASDYEHWVCRRRLRSGEGPANEEAPVSGPTARPDCSMIVPPVRDD